MSSVVQAYLRMEVTLASLKETWEPDRADELARLSQEARAGHCREVLALERSPEAAEARSAGVQALAQGLMCGAWDGLVIYQADRLPAPLEVAPGPLERPLSLLRAGLEQAAQVAHGDWRSQHPDNLHLLSGYGKQQNEATAEEAEAASRGTLEEYQVFLLATFKAGYAIGLVDAAVLCVTGETPGQSR